jgi:hypothetical protein
MTAVGYESGLTNMPEGCPRGGVKMPKSPGRMR